MTRKANGSGEKTRKDDAHRWVQVPFRVDDWRLIEAVEAYGKQLRHKRNMAIILLLEEVLTQKGLWPPKEEVTAGASGDSVG